MVSIGYPRAASVKWVNWSFLGRRMLTINGAHITWIRPLMSLGGIRSITDLRVTRSESNRRYLRLAPAKQTAN